VADSGYGTAVAALGVQLFISMSNGWLQNALRYC